LGFLNKKIHKLLILMSLDFLIFSSSVWLGICLRVGRWEFFFKQWKIMAIVGVLGVVIFLLGGVYKIVLRYLDERDIARILVSIAVTALAMSLVLFWYPFLVVGGMPRSVIVLFLLLSSFGVTGYRIVYVLGSSAPKTKYSKNKQLTSKRKQKVVIFGAGESGHNIMSSLRNSSEYQPVGFIDDNPIFQKRKVSELPIFSRENFLAFHEKSPVDIVLIAVPRASRQLKNEAISWARKIGVVVKSLPNYEDLTTGKVTIEEIQEVDIGDLLGRDKVEPSVDLMRKNITNKVVLVSGAGGSIGSELCRQIVKFKPKTLILFDNSEYALYQIEQSLHVNKKVLVGGFDNQLTEIIPVIGSVQNRECLQELFTEFTIDTICHAAAYKHVPLVEQNLSQGIRNNVLGTLTLAEVAQQHKVNSFILISTDKAVRPTNFMGASKRLAELALKALHNAEQGEDYYLSASKIQNNATTFSMVRFGNVLDSSGSVIPKFRKQIKQGGPLTITDKEITRFFMTIPEAAELVIQAGAMAEGGEVYLLDMGEPVKIDKLARNLIQLSGLSVKDEKNPNGDIAVTYTGLRPGEKLYEELLIAEDSSLATENKKIFKAVDSSLPWREYKQMLDALQSCLHEKNFENLIALMEKYVEGFAHKGNCEDITWRVKK
jgi:FlaA1/EpsC-like NDP-sugar epimerase